LRGFLVCFDCEPTLPHAQPDLVEQQLAAWERSFASSNLRQASAAGCRFYLYSHSPDGAVPADFNQKLRRAQDGVSLWVGPRVDMADEALLHSSEPSDPIFGEQAAPAALETAICVRFRTHPHSLIVKTDVINSTFVYWTQAGRWLLFSNSSLTLAQVTRAEIDWCSASEFLASGSIYGNHSLYKNVATLKPATLYAFTERASATSRSYWELHRLPFETLAAEEACDRVVRELDRDFADLASTGKTFILDLTGGYDSRTNLGFALRKLAHFQTTVSGLPQDEDVKISSALAKHFRIKHTVISPVEDDEGHEQRLAECALITDCEYDLVEYARIYKAQTRFDTPRQPSIHGSGGDIARNYLLRPEFCAQGPEGKLILEPLINSRFRCAIPPDWSRPDSPIADWTSHIRSRIAEYDAPDLPAFARLDILYLRMRMQFWQSRIASSTNRFRSSFSPWMNRRVLEAMLTSRWRERRHQMLSRLFLRALNRDLTRFVVARGEPAGPDLWSAIVALPARLRYYAGRVAIRLGRPASRSYVVGPRYEQLAPQWEQLLPNMLRPEAASKLAWTAARTAQPQVLGRLVSLAHAREALRTLR
jgi:hypothetical protein